MAGKISVNQVQLGDSSTATHNFVWQTNADGSCKLARGNAGATTQDILTVDASGGVAFPNQVGFQSKAWCRFDGTVTGVNAPLAGGNVTSVTRESAGVYLLTFTATLPNTNYAVLVTSQLVAGAGSRNNLCSAEAVSTTTARLRCHSAADGAATDQKIISVVVFG